MPALKHKGFSVVEMIIYVALLILFVILVVDTIILMSGSYRKLTLARTIATSAAVSMERMTREIRQSTDVDNAASSLDTSAGRLGLLTTDDSGAAETISFALENGRINVYENGVLSGPLTSASASTTVLRFHLYQSGASKAIQILMTLQAQNASETRTETFQTSVELRNSSF